jgi:hypothetical protein
MRTRSSCFRSRCLSTCLARSIRLPDFSIPYRSDAAFPSKGVFWTIDQRRMVARGNLTGALATLLRRKRGCRRMPQLALGITFAVFYRIGGLYAHPATPSGARRMLSSLTRLELSPASSSCPAPRKNLSASLRCLLNGFRVFVAKANQKNPSPKLGGLRRLPYSLCLRFVICPTCGDALPPQSRHNPKVWPSAMVFSPKVPAPATLLLFIRLLKAGCSASSSTTNLLNVPHHESNDFTLGPISTQHRYWEVHPRGRHRSMSLQSPQLCEYRAHPTMLFSLIFFH